MWYRKAADQGHADAQCNLGLMYAKGEGVARSLETALVWFQKAAAQGDSEAKKYATVAEEHLRASRTASQPQQQRKVGNHQCAACGAASGPGGTAIKPCGRCKRVSYCGKECQRAHWKAGHKAACVL